MSPPDNLLAALNAVAVVSRSVTGHGSLDLYPGQDVGTIAFTFHISAGECLTEQADLFVRELEVAGGDILFQMQGDRG
jgi:hypothetical protein